MLGVHKAATGNHLPIKVAIPPVVTPEPLASYVYSPFNKREFAVSLARYHPDFESAGCSVMDPVVTDTKMKKYR